MKYSRHAKIIEIIEGEVIETQEEIADRLKQNGYDVTQATISRDIKELKLVKVQHQDGRYRYSQISQSDGAVSNRMLNIFSEAYLGSDFANNIIVLKTLPGMANAVGECIDSLKWSEVLGTIAGDNSLMVVCRSDKNAEFIVNKFAKMAKG